MAGNFKGEDHTSPDSREATIIMKTKKKMYSKCPYCGAGVDTEEFVLLYRLRFYACGTLASTQDKDHPVYDNRCGGDRN